MTKQFETYLPLSNPSPKSGVERRRNKADLDAQISASNSREVPLTLRPSRPTIGVLPTYPFAEAQASGDDSLDEVPFIDPDEPGETDPDKEVTEKTRVSVVIPR